MSDSSVKDHVTPACETDFASRLLDTRYVLKDSEGMPVETPDQLYMRVAEAMAAPEACLWVDPKRVWATAGVFCGLMRRGLFLPNSPALMNAGRANGVLSACFVVGLGDSVEGIFETIKRAALVQKAGGGTGFSFDRLRPTGDSISSTGGVTSGPVSFWRVLSEASTSIQQGAHRRGANMAMMSVSHPDILNFIAAKRGPTAFENFNISVKVPDRFMAQLSEAPDKPHEVINPRMGNRYLLPRSLKPGLYGLRDLVPVEKAGGVRCYAVGDVWNAIVAHAHATGEPGVCFIDRVNRDNPTPSLGPIEALNPCGEQPLLNEEACCLGSINVAKFVLRDREDMAWRSLGSVVRWAVRFLDNLIDANHYPLPEIEKISRGNRKIGLGIMGFADALVLLGLRYDSEEAVGFAKKLGAFIQRAAHGASERLGRERGCFPNWIGSTLDTEHGRPMRNATCTTIAPTGSISILARCSAGIEPIYRLGYRRRALDGREYVQLHPLVEQIGGEGGWLTETVSEALLAGSAARDIGGIPRKLAPVLVTAHEVSPAWHVRMQAAFQENVDNAVSKTVNLPAAATVEEVDQVYRLAFELGAKGITVYRDGSRAGQTFSSGGMVSKSARPANEMPRLRDRVAVGRTFKFRMGCGTLFVTVNRDEYGLCEVFSNLGKAGGCPSQSEATCRAVSAALRSGVKPAELIEQLRGIRCLSTAMARKKRGSVDVLSCPDAIARAIEEFMNGSSGQGEPEGQSCPDCGSALRRESGCEVCSCGFSRCG